MNNIGFASSAPVVAPERASARDRLRNRSLTIVGCNLAAAIAPHLDAEYEGLVVTGQKRLETVRNLRRVYKQLVLIAEPDSHKEFEATESRPWYLPGFGDDGLFPSSTVDEILEDQRNSGASVVLPPSGFIGAGDVRTLRETVTVANALKGDDIALPLYLASGWLQPNHEEFLVAALSASSHPVLLAFGSQTNPIDSKRKLEIYKRVIARSEAMCWRTDFAGLEAFSNGGLGVAVGSIPSLRRFTPPNASGKAHHPYDSTPYVLIPGHMHWMKSGAMREDLFVATPAPACGCDECKGLRVDRFSEAETSSAAIHNHFVVDDYMRQILAVEPQDRPALWRDFAQDALIAHEITASKVGRPWPAPAEVVMFATD